MTIRFRTQTNDIIESLHATHTTHMHNAISCPFICPYLMLYKDARIPAYMLARAST